MIDFHSHIIPQVDDGSENLNQTDELLNEAKKAGFDKIILTPHYIKTYYESNTDQNRLWVEGIEKIIEKEGLDLKVYLGNESYLSDDILNLLETREITTINSSKYLLMEMPLNAKPANMFNVAYELKEKGIVPIIAHPERYLFMQQDPFTIYQLIKNGCLAQSNFGSFVGYYGKKAQILAQKLIENNMIHFLGSDVHRPNTIYMQISEAKKKIINIIGEYKFNQITVDNPKHVINNEDFEVESPEQLKFNFIEKRKLDIKE